MLSFLMISSTIFAGNDNSPKKNKTIPIDAKNSNIEWHAKKVTGTHTGTVPVSSGTLVMDNKTLKGGTFLIDVKSLVVTDVKDADMNGKLTTHLKSDDFFSVEKNPLAKLVITEVTPSTNNAYEVTALLTIKGITNTVKFPATVKTSGKKVTADAKVTVDRTKYDIKFRSTNFFENLGDKAIMDDFILHVNLVANM